MGKAKELSAQEKLDKLIKGIVTVQAKLNESAKQDFYDLKQQCKSYPYSRASFESTYDAIRLINKAMKPVSDFHWQVVKEERKRKKEKKRRLKALNAMIKRNSKKV